MAFLKVVEVFPPLFPLSGAEGRHLGLKGGVERFVEEARVVRDVADVILVADVKNQKGLRMSTLGAAALLSERLGVKAAPVVVVRDLNRLSFTSSILTGMIMDLGSMMIVWGDRLPAGGGTTNVRDFSTLAEAIKEASKIRARARARAQLLAPVDLDSLASPRGVERARKRLRAGADYLLAQPPTTDAGATFDRHAGLLEPAGLKGKVLLNVFPFRDARDARECEKYFGWKLPRSLHQIAAAGPDVLSKEQEDVVGRLREEGFPGVYLNTRGAPEVAVRLLS